MKKTTKKKKVARLHKLTIKEAKKIVRERRRDTNIAKEGPITWVKRIKKIQVMEKVKAEKKNAKKANTKV